MIIKKTTLILLIAIGTLLIGQEKSKDNIVVISNGLSSPESTFFSNGFIYISNQDGSGISKDSSGWISKVKINGEVVKSRWIEGLNAPKGLRSWGTSLFTADIDKLVIIDLLKEKIVEQIEIPNAKLLNDIAIDVNGDLYISDTLERAIYKISNVFSKNRKIEKWVESLKYSPNGLYIYEKNLYVAGWGSDIGEDFQTKELGKLYKISLKNKKYIELTKSIGNLDGIERLNNGKWIFSALRQNYIYIFDPKTKKTYIYNSKNSPADIGIIEKENILMIPSAIENKVYLMFDKQLF